MPFPYLFLLAGAAGLFDQVTPGQQLTIEIDS